VTCEMCRSGSVGLGVGWGGSLGGLRGVRGYYEEYCQTQVPDAAGSSTSNLVIIVLGTWCWQSRFDW
jgi:hypothetical protein